METEKKQKKSRKFYWFALGIGLAAAVCSVCLAVGSNKAHAQNEVVNVDRREKDNTQYIHAENGQRYILNKSSNVLAVIFPSDALYRLEKGDSLQYTGGCTIYTYYTNITAHIDIEADGEFIGSAVIDDEEGYNTEIDYYSYVITDTPFINGNVVPSFPQDITLTGDDMNKLFYLENDKQASKFVRKITLRNLDFKLGFNEPFISFDENNHFDQIDILYIHSYRVKGLGTFADAHDLLFYIAVNSTSKYCVTFASNVPYGAIWRNGWQSNGFTYYFPSQWISYILGYRDKVTAQDWDSAYYAANRQEVLDGCQFIQSKDVNFFNLHFESPAYLDNREKKTVFLSNWTQSQIEDETFWLTTVTTLIGTSIVALMPLFSLTVLPGITLGFLFFFPFFITLFIIIIKALKK